jgi:hypothetical protein
MIVDRRATYFTRSAMDRAQDGLEFQRRFLAGLRFLENMANRNVVALRPTNVTVLRKKRNTT